MRWRTVALAVLLAAVLGTAVAGPADAAQDPARPQATVTKGPSCDPGGMEFEVVAGTAPYAVRLATTREPGGEDEARLAPGATAVLRTGPIDWGETVDPRLVYTAVDASGTSFTDQLDDWSMTRPSREDCAAIGAAAAGTTTSAGTTDAPRRSTSAPAPRTPEAPTSAPGPATPESDQTDSTAVVASGAAGGDGPSSRAVGAGRPITVRATGFTPGEHVTVRLRGAGVLGRATAGPDGAVAVQLFVPAEASGTTNLDVVGATSGVTAGLQLHVAALHSAQPRGSAPVSWPALLALLSLVASGGWVVAALGRRRGLRRGRPLASG